MSYKAKMMLTTRLNQQTEDVDGKALQGWVFKGRLPGKSVFPWHGNYSPLCVYSFKVEKGRK